MRISADHDVVTMAQAEASVADASALLASAALCNAEYQRQRDSPRNELGGASGEVITPPGVMTTASRLALVRFVPL
jgi:hypothetical protein